MKKEGKLTANCTHSNRRGGRGGRRMRSGWTRQPGGLQATDWFGGNYSTWRRRAAADDLSTCSALGGEKETPASPPQSLRALRFLTVCLRLSCVASSSSFSCKEEMIMFLRENDCLMTIALMI